MTTQRQEAAVSTAVATARSALPSALSAARRAQVPPFHAMRMFEAATARRATGAAVFDLSAGQPGTPAPAAVRAAAHRALDADQLGYTASSGLPQLRAAIAGHYRHRYGLDVSPTDVVATTGSSGAFLLAFLAAFDAGDVVALARPGYPAYRNLLRALGCTVVELPGDASTRFQPTVAQLERLDPRPAGLVLASPANPTGTMVSAGELAELTRWCAGHGVRLISDEIYHGITYTQPAASAWQYDRSTVVVNSFSKYFSMTGWRLGWMLAPADLRDTVDRLAGNFALCPPTLAQHAAVLAFDNYAELDANVARYAANRQQLLTGLARLGVDQLAPADGAFYAYADVSAFTDDSLAFCARMLSETGVATTPGIDFDAVNGNRFLRASFAGSAEVVSGALEALAGWLPAQRRA